MQQNSLFAVDPHVLLDDESGEIRYVPDCVPASTAGPWFENLRDGLNWSSERRRMYERDVDVPRLVAGFRLDDPHLPASIADAHAIVAKISASRFNSVGLNFYRDGNDSVALHNDKLHTLRVGFPIALLSLGATRRMTIRSKSLPRRTLHIDLEAGSVLTMSHSSQLHYEHGIQKQRGTVGARISLVFRMRPDRI